MTDPLVDATWLGSHREEVVVADVRWAPTLGTAEAERLFAAGHIPGAVFFDVDRDLAGAAFTGGPGRHPTPTPEGFARTLGRAGIGDEDKVVAYDDVGGSYAARLWWMLEATGRRCVVLDGGLGAWSGPLETGAAHQRPATEVAGRPWSSELLADADDVRDALTAGAIVLDARAGDRYRGETEPFDPVAGHIPGARSAPWTENLAGGGLLRSPVELRERFAAIGVHDASTAIAYCGSGVTAAHDVLAMRVAGLGTARLYEGSWSDWVHDPARPIATGDEP
jgi:thiosulfate/3-mercaptopyruvate sulfurtransferase